MTPAVTLLLIFCTHVHNYYYFYINSVQSQSVFDNFDNSYIAICWPKHVKQQSRIQVVLVVPLCWYLEIITLMLMPKKTALQNFVGVIKTSGRMKWAVMSQLWLPIHLRQWSFIVLGCGNSGILCRLYRQIKLSRNSPHKDQNYDQGWFTNMYRNVSLLDSFITGEKFCSHSVCSPEL